MPRWPTARKSIAPVDKICGPGNIYVALAKRAVFGVVDIDSIAGPSEIVVLADDTADPAYVAADLLSQAEHDEMASAILVTTVARAGAKRSLREVERQLRRCRGKRIAAVHRQLRRDPARRIRLDEGDRRVNRLAPEHLEVLTADPMTLLGRIENAGAIFLGPYSSEPVGDYFAGPNHILPTNGTARFSSPVNVDDFMKKSSLIHYSKEALLANGDRL